MQQNLEKKKKENSRGNVSYVKEAHKNVPGSQTRVFEWNKVSRGLGGRPGQRALGSSLNESHHCNGEKCALWV